MTKIEIALSLVSVAGVIGTFYFGITAGKLYRERIRFTWDELHAGGRDLAKKVKEVGFLPEIVLTPSIRGATVAGIVVLEFDNQLPMFTCVQEDVRNTPFSFRPHDHTMVETGKWRIHI